MTRRPVVAAAILATLLSAPPLLAQAPAAASQTCDQKDAEAKRDWAASSHTWLANVLHKEARDISDAWCRIWETSGRDRTFKAENFGRVLFTGEGIHPVVAGSLVPGSGFAGGARFQADRALLRPVRLSGAADFRAAVNGSWATAGRLELLGSASRTENRHNHATVLVERQHLASLSYYGPVGADINREPTAFALNRTFVGGALTLPIPRGAFVSVTAGGAWLDPGLPTSGTRPPALSTFQATTTPALDTATSYLVAGAGAGWRFPSDPTMQGYRTTAGVALRSFHETNGRPHSFRRLDLDWEHRYAAAPTIGSFTAVGFATVSFTADGDAVPFYLQPTIGGTGLDGRPALRSFADYRFRGPDVVGFTLEHERPIGSVFGSLLFIDLGQAAQRPSSFRLTDFHHSFGAGVTLRVGNTTVLRLFYAWGGGEGRRTTVSGSSDRFGPSSAGLVPF